VQEADTKKLQMSLKYETMFLLPDKCKNELHNTWIKDSHLGNNKIDIQSADKMNDNE